MLPASKNKSERLLLPAQKQKQLLQQGHRARMRQKFVASPTHMLDYEVLEILLYYIFPRKDTRELAKVFMQQFGTLHDLVFSEKTDISQVEGAGKSTAFFFFVIREIFIRASLDEIKKSPVISSEKDVINYYKSVFGGLKHEQLRIMFLNSKSFLISDEILSEGTVDKTCIYSRTVIKRSLELGASAIIMAHNHPSGDPTPSHQDIVATKSLADVAEKLGIKLLDHVIIGKGRTFSMKGKGLM